MRSHLTGHWKLAVVWAFSLVAVATISLAAQGDPRSRGLDRPAATLQIPTVVSGNDVGFRIERTQNGIQIGKVVVRINGVWVDTAESAGVTR
jgi:hypothetical protein